MKRMLNASDLVVHMQNKGIKFENMTVEAARLYLKNSNNYFKLSSYRKNYLKQNQDKYIDLDFSYLIELARLDVEIRHMLLKMSLDIEHFMKVALLKEVESNFKKGTENGYKVVDDYLSDRGNENDPPHLKTVERRKNSFNSRIKNNNNPYCDGLINKHKENMPIWVFIEIISFGDLTEIIKYYSKSTKWTPPVDSISLDKVRQIRNACAHNNCIINDLKSEIGNKNAPLHITEFLAKCDISKNVRAKKLQNKRIFQIVNLLYVYDKIVKSEYSRNIRNDELNNLFSIRLKKHTDYFTNNTLLTSTYSFFYKIIEYFNNG